ncbi:hypothetical protein AUQ38_18625 [Pseudomonas aeruginosa]|nr:hypothetical protein AUQ38_18625 [Pseudomonas aeruginosa]
MGLEGVELVSFRRDQIIQRRQAVGDFLLFIAWRDWQFKLGKLLVTDHLSITKPLKIFDHLSDKTISF